MSIPIQLALFLAALLASNGTTLSYRNLTSPESAQALYRSGGASNKAQRVHVHVPATRILAKPSRIAKTKLGQEVWILENQSVPLVVAPDSVYFQKILARAEKGERVCIKGEIKDEPAGGKDRLALFVHQVKRAHDKPQSDESSRSGGKKPKAKKAGTFKT